MRVNDRGASQGSTQARAAARFGEVLREARAGAARRARTDAAPQRPEARRATSARGNEDAATRREADRAEERAAAAGDPARPGASAAVEPTMQIAALVRTLPVAIAAARAREGAPLELSFGRSLDVELRAGAGGVEILLRPEPRLLRAAEAELPRVVAALRLRGVAVARAEVRTRHESGRDTSARRSR